MPKVVVDVMPKPEILDPQGKAVLGALPRLGFDGVVDVRQGKRFELEAAGEVSEAETRLDAVPGTDTDAGAQQRDLVELNSAFAGGMPHGLQGGLQLGGAHSRVAAGQ